MFHKKITKAKSPLGLNAPMLPMMIDSTTAAMLETHGNSLLLQDPSMSSTNQNNNNLMNMSFTEGVTNKMNLNNELSSGPVVGVGSPELPNGKIANPLPRKAYRRRTLMNENQEPNAVDGKEKERRHRSRRHSHHHKSMHTKDMTPEELEKLAERRERRHSRRPDETESERRERHERRKSRRPLTIIDENGVEKVVHRHRRHHHRSSRYVAEDGTELPEKPKSSSHRHSRHRQSVAVGEQQQHSHHTHPHDYLRSRHQSLAPNKTNQPNIESTSFNLDTRSLNDIQVQNKNENNNTQNASITNNTTTNLPTQEINDFFDNIFKLNWSL